MVKVLDLSHLLMGRPEWPLNKTSSFVEDALDFIRCKAVYVINAPCAKGAKDLWRWIIGPPSVVANDVRPETWMKRLGGSRNYGEKLENIMLAETINKSRTMIFQPQRWLTEQLWRWCDEAMRKLPCLACAAFAKLKGWKYYRIWRDGSIAAVITCHKRKIW